VLSGWAEAPDLGDVNSGCKTRRNYRSDTGSDRYLPTPATSPGPTGAARAANITRRDLKNGLFVGIALSGGGSRAANFSAAVLLELERLGLLPADVAAISSVSGSSLTGAYYGLYRNQTGWNWDSFKTLLRTDLETLWIARLFLPHNVPRLLLTDYTRTHVMADVFDHVFFHGLRFANLPAGNPKMYINATIRSSACEAFVFTEENFADFPSRLETYRISHAVMASGAFPGVFHDITLTQRSKSGRRFLNVYDGGATDNLGVTTLLAQLAPLLERVPFPWREPSPVSGCFLVVVDATRSNQTAGAWSSSPRSWRDIFIDGNVIHAIDAVFRKDRTYLLHSVLKLSPGRQPGISLLFHNVPILPHQSCTVWVLPLGHIEVFGSMLSMSTAIGTEFDRAAMDKGAQLNSVLSQVETRYALKAGPYTPDEIQDKLFEAAKMLVWDDAVALNEVCEWFRVRGAPLSGCVARAAGVNGER
jgi:predicted acylesterase/phospholipase RssA